MGTGKSRSAWRAVLREPLLHFLLLGALIFAADGIANPPSKQDRTIRVTSELTRDFTKQFEEAKGRTPTNDELEYLIDAWTTNEILYREAKSLELDRGDEMIRERIIQKMRLLIFNDIPPPEPTLADVRAWFEAHRDRWDRPELLEFFEVPVSGDGAEGERAAHDALEAIHAERETDEFRGKARIYRSRSAASVDQAFGSGFAERLRALPLGTWSVVRSTTTGWHIVRIDTITPGVPAKFEDVSGEAADEWRQAQQRRLAREAVRKLGAGYDVRRDDEEQSSGGARASAPAPVPTPLAAPEREPTPQEARGQG